MLAWLPAERQVDREMMAAELQHPRRRRGRRAEEREVVLVLAEVTAAAAAGTARPAAARAGHLRRPAGRGAAPRGPPPGGPPPGDRRRAVRARRRLRSTSSPRMISVTFGSRPRLSAACSSVITAARCGGVRSPRRSPSRWNIGLGKFDHRALLRGVVEGELHLRLRPRRRATPGRHWRQTRCAPSRQSERRPRRAAPRRGPTPPGSQSRARSSRGETGYASLDSTLFSCDTAAARSWQSGGIIAAR